MTAPNIHILPDGDVQQALYQLDMIPSDQRVIDKGQGKGKALCPEGVKLLETAAGGATSDGLIEIVITAIAAQPVSKSDQNGIVAALVDASGLSPDDIGDRLKAARKQAQGERRADSVDAGYISSDMKHSHIALVLARKLADTCRYDEPTKRWYLKSGNIWKPVAPGMVLRKVKATLDKAMTGEGYNASVLSGVESLLRIDLQSDGWEESRHLLPMENGVMNLKTKTLEPYGSRAFVWQLPYAHDPAASCPTVDEYLESATGGDKALENLLVAWMWVVLHGRSDLQKYLEMVGHGGTGKSTFLALCKLLVGEENMVVTDLKTLEKNQFESANLKDKRLVQVTDSSRFGGEVAMLKAITGEDPLRYERKNIQAESSFVYRGLVMIAANEAIQSSDYTSGLARRKIPVTMNARVTEDQKAKHRANGGILKVMASEMPGLVNKLLSLDESWVMDIINNPAGEVLRQKIEAELRVNPVLAWLDECVVQCGEGQEEDFIGKATQEPQLFLYPNYADWCKGQGREAMAIQRFSGLVVDNCKTWGIETGVDKKRLRGAQGKVLAGLRLRTASDDHIGGLISIQGVKCDEAAPICDEVEAFCDEVEVFCDEAKNTVFL